MLGKMQELLANTFKDSRTISDSLEPPRRSSRLSILSSISMQIDARESNKEDDLSSERIEKEDNDVDYALESQTEEEPRIRLIVQKKPVS